MKQVVVASAVAEDPGCRLHDTLSRTVAAAQTRMNVHRAETDYWMLCINCNEVKLLVHGLHGKSASAEPMLGSFSCLTTRASIVDPVQDLGLLCCF